MRIKWDFPQAKLVKTHFGFEDRLAKDLDIVVYTSWFVTDKGWPASDHFTSLAASCAAALTGSNLIDDPGLGVVAGG